jgi:hypothetical protein
MWSPCQMAPLSRYTQPDASKTCSTPSLIPLGTGNTVHAYTTVRSVAKHAQPRSHALTPLLPACPHGRKYRIN